MDVFVCVLIAKVYADTSAQMRPDWADKFVAECPHINSAHSTGYGNENGRSTNRNANFSALQLSLSSSPSSGSDDFQIRSVFGNVVYGFPMEVGNYIEPPNKGEREVRTSPYSNINYDNCVRRQCGDCGYFGIFDCLLYRWNRIELHSLSSISKSTHNTQLHASIFTREYLVRISPREHQTLSICLVKLTCPCPHYYVALRGVAFTQSLRPEYVQPKC